jgi:hypothetical protein
MSIDQPSRRNAPASDSSIGNPAQRLRQEFAAVKISFTWLGVRKSLSSEQKSLAAEQFGAEGQFLSAAKKLLDTRHSGYRAVTAIRGRITAYWRALTLPFPEPGVRLLRQDQVDPFDRQLGLFRTELDAAVEELNRQYGDLQEAARQRLGSLYNADDYPAALTGLFAVAWEFPSVEPPPYLLQLKPELFEQEKARVAARFEEAVMLAEQAFTEELSALVNHLSERLAGSEDGKPKTFRDSAVENLKEFFGRFGQLNIRSNEQLDELVHRAQSIVSDASPQQLRENQTLRQQVHGQLAVVQQSLDGLLVDRPRRRILRNTASSASPEKEEAA